ncbi:MAG: hypothetical protein IRY94_19295, partial [Rhodospirillaceae bacterium]|nr:hypothetical protein [Rhodospirillaceae bacterium]
MTAPTLHRVRIRLETPLGTPLTSGTLFGHLCWAVREEHGEDALARWLAAQDAAPWIVSDGFPEGLLPRPLLPPAPLPARPSAEQADAAKEDKRKTWVRVADFLALRDRLSAQALAARACRAPWEERKETAQHGTVRLAHNTIDRRRGTTPEEGGLYFVDEDWT